MPVGPVRTALLSAPGLGCDRVGISGGRHPTPRAPSTRSAPSTARSGPNRAPLVRRISKFLGAVALVLTTLGVIFVVGMRQKSPRVLNAVRRTSRATKGLVL